MKTLGSRRISSTSASLMAAPNVISRVSGIDVLIDFIHGGIRRFHGELNRLFHFAVHFGLDLIETGPIGNFLFDEPVAEQRDGIAFGFPELLFLFRTIVFAVDVTDMMSGKPVRAAQKELRSAAC